MLEIGDDLLSGSGHEGFLELLMCSLKEGEDYFRLHCKWHKPGMRHRSV